MKPSYVVAGVILIVSMVFSLFAFSGAIVQHVTIHEAMAQPGETVQVPGMIDKSSVHYDARRGELRFDLVAIDPNTRKPDPSQRMTVAYRATKPENFDSANNVEAKGKYRDGVFHADDVLVKCPSKYSDEKSAKTAGM